MKTNSKYLCDACIVGFGNPRQFSGYRITKDDMVYGRPCEKCGKTGEVITHFPIYIKLRK